MFARSRLNRSAPVTSLKGEARGLPLVARSLLFKNTLWMLVGNVVVAACQLVIMILLARRGSPTIVGQFSLALAVTSPLAILLSLKLRAVQATDSRDEYRFSEYVALRIVTALLLPLLAAAVATIAGYTSTIRALIIVMSVAKAFDSLGDIAQGLFQRHENMKLVARSLMLRGGGTLAGLAVGYLLTDSLVIATVLMAVASAIVFVFHDLRHATWMTADNAPARRATKVLFADVRPDRLRMLTRLALPLGAAVFVGSLWTTTPRYFIEHYLDSHDLGIFAAVSTFLAMGTLVINAVAQAASPRLANLYAHGEYQHFDSLVIRLCGVGGAIGVTALAAAVLFGESLLNLVFGAEYAAQSQLLVLLVAVMALQYTFVFIGTSVNAMRRFTVQLPIHAASLTLLTGLCLVFIPRYGLNGAVLAMAASNLVESFCYLVVLLRYRFAVGRTTASLLNNSIPIEGGR